MLSKVGPSGTGAQMVLVTIWSTLAVFWIVPAIFERVYRSPIVSTLYHLPVPDEMIFEHRFRALVLNAGGWLLADLAVIMGSLHIFQGWEISAGAIAVTVAVVSLQAAVVMACATLAARHAPSLPYRLIVWLVVMGVILPVWIGSKSAVNTIGGSLQTIAGWPFWALPTGWLTRTHTEAMGEFWLSALLPIPAVICLMIGARLAYRDLKSSYTLTEEMLPHPGSIGNPLRNDEEGLQEERTRAGITEIEDRIFSREFLTPSAVRPEGIIEQTALGALNPKERELVAVFNGQEPRWTRQWKRRAILLAFLGSLAVAGQNKALALVFYLVCGVSLLAVIPLGNPLPTAFQMLFLSGTNIPLYAGFPVSFKQLASIILRISTIRWAAALPLVLAFCAACGVIGGSGVTAGVMAGLKAGWLLLVIQPLLVVMFFSSGSNDSSQFRWRQLPGLVAFLTGFALTGGLCLAVIFSRNPAVVIWCGMGALVCAWILLWAYARMFRTGKFDLLQIPQVS
ncbi:MAG TPA: hypothetical protein VEH27_11430 [Methylomirabilota bacterium]|nr:hypothetical protein [Methylomirabilota bacterium]